MTELSEGDRVRIVATGQRGVIVKALLLARPRRYIVAIGLGVGHGRPQPRSVRHEYTEDELELEPE